MMKIYKGEWKGGWSDCDSSYDDGKFILAVQFHENNFTGIARDKHEYSDIKGKINGEEIKFVKTYRNRPEGSISSFSYEGKIDGSGVSGRWYPDTQFPELYEGTNYTFLMKESVLPSFGTIRLKRMLTAA